MPESKCAPRSWAWVRLALLSGLLGCYSTSWVPLPQTSLAPVGSSVRVTTVSGDEIYLWEVQVVEDTLLVGLATLGVRGRRIDPIALPLREIRTVEVRNREPRTNMTAVLGFGLLITVFLMVAGSP